MKFVTLIFLCAFLNACSHSVLVKNCKPVQDDEKNRSACETLKPLD